VRLFSGGGATQASLSLSLLSIEGQQ